MIGRSSWPLCSAFWLCRLSVFGRTCSSAGRSTCSAALLSFPVYSLLTVIGSSTCHLCSAAISGLHPPTPRGVLEHRCCDCSLSDTRRAKISARVCLCLKKDVRQFCSFCGKRSFWNFFSNKYQSEHLVLGLRFGTYTQSLSLSLSSKVNLNLMSKVQF